MQEALLAEAERAGVQVRRGVTVEGIELSPKNPIVIARNKSQERIAARLVVAADGRGSGVRKWGGFTTQKNVLPFHFAGVLLTEVSGRDDLIPYLFNPDLGLVVAVVPLPKQRSRAYLGYPTTAGQLVQGNEKLGTFMTESQKVAPNLRESYAQAKSAGPLAAFEVGESWVDHPYRDGVALLGDAASTSDPTFGQGLATTFKDARVLRDALLGQSDWDRAGHEYARCHDGYFQKEYKVCGWLRTLFQDPSPQAQALRQYAMPRIAEDLSRVPDHLFSGPDLPVDDSVRARLFGEC